MLQVNGINIKLIRVTQTTTPQVLIDEIQVFWKMYNSPVFIELPNQPLQHIEAFYRPDSFGVLNRLRREYNTPIIFIIPGGVRLMNEARRAGFPVYSALSEGVEALAQLAQDSSSTASSTTNGHAFSQNNYPSSSATNTPGNGLFPPYISNSPSWSGLPPQENLFETGQFPSSTALPFSKQAVFAEPKAEPRIPFPSIAQNFSGEKVEAERVDTRSNQHPKEFGFTSQMPTPFSQNAVAHRPIYRQAAFLVTIVILVFLLIAGSFLVLQSKKGVQTHTNPSTPKTTSFVPAYGIGVELAPDGEYIGLSDGTFAFDTTRLDGATKLQGSEKLRSGDTGTALSLWHDAVSSDTNDAETLIYLEDQRVLSTGSPYVTLVVGTMDTGTYISLGRDDLQGAYLAQKEYNDKNKLSGGVLVRLLIASTGNDKEYANIVAKQIVEAAKTDHTIVGVMGWPYSSRTLNVVQTLTDAHIPIVSQMASSVLLTGVSPYFFRIVPPDSTQAALGAVFTENTLHAKSAALFIDPSDAYSSSIGNAFKQKFESDGNSVVVTENYVVGKPDTISSTLQDALLHNPDVIYFAGLADDANTLLAHLPTQGEFAQIKVVGGDGLYSIGSYSKDAVVQQNFHRLCFSAFAYADTWGYLGSKTEPVFFSDYPAAFDPYQKHDAGTYGYDRADGDVILSYDATAILLAAYQKVLSTSTSGASTSVTSEEMRTALASISNTDSIQGVSGRIAFGSNNDPVDKSVVMLAVSSAGRVQLQSVGGKFFV